ncbi:anthranilate phosphoribosyltransferase [Sporomusa sphaeroides]|uniref:Anthranilate phosphoribosyltransferase 2 n=1 Tax=Sporomusa sphaeroides DSM 2875 TaxID=1337886 RepID=A0ABP2C6C7_9FIRM|nr:anthranilate phosphoribosyltransferase [Sporomusa sphaeroides]OLS56222.1 anthranilate phosphoribosyltransferase 2 [Sporomusa sphaeroides DSM 2875]CVK19136.1 Anthranilate phosphoribosyltransferase 2 [Sporomusa sphaeroides DSM 2875]
MLSDTLTCKKLNPIRLVKKVIEDNGFLSVIEAEFLFEYLWEHPKSAYQFCAILAVLKNRGETKDELLGLSRVIRRKMKTISLNVTGAIDIGGTGGGKPTFNISTTVAFILAAAGCRVCKHGSNKISSSSGSIDLLNALGLNTQKLSSHSFAKMLYDQFGITFFVTKSYHCHPSFLADMRASLAVSTAFNIIGPLFNPACVPYQIVGVSDQRKMDTMAEILIEQGREAFLLVHGIENIDELSPCGKSKVLEYKDGVLRRYNVCPSDFGLEPIASLYLEGGSPEENASIFYSIIKNESPERMQAILPTSAAALYICGAAKTIQDGVNIAKETIVSGKVSTLFSKLQEVMT